jgi:hypothetical protein
LNKTGSKKPGLPVLSGYVKNRPVPIPIPVSGSALIDILTDRFKFYIQSADLQLQFDSLNLPRIHLARSGTSMFNNFSMANE